MQAVGEQTPCTACWRRHARERPSALALKDQPNREELTGDAPLSLRWAELDRASENLAVALQDLGVRADDRLIVQLPNVVELAVLYYAASKLGAIVSPVPVQYSSHELRKIAATLDATAMITIERLRDVTLAEQAREALPDLRVLVFGSDLRLDTRPGNRSCSRGPEDANAILTICWTSGTTGTPKGVPRSHNMWVATGRQSVEAGSYTPEDVLLNPFPLVNMAALGGFLFPSALLGSAIVLHHPLDPPLFLRQMQDERVTFTIAPPALLNQLAKSPELWRQFDFSALRSVGSGSAPLAPWMIDTFGREYGVEIVNFYGSNEGISLFATPATAPEPEVRAAMFRKPPAGASIATRVADQDSGEDTGTAGTRGELLISGATVFDGYLDHDNSDVFTQDGYFCTGDLVEICGEQGNLLPDRRPLQGHHQSRRHENLPGGAGCRAGAASRGDWRRRCAPTRMSAWAKRSAPAWCPPQGTPAPQPGIAAGLSAGHRASPGSSYRNGSKSLSNCPAMPWARCSVLCCRTL